MSFDRVGNHEKRDLDRRVEGLGNHLCGGGAYHVQPIAGQNDFHVSHALVFLAWRLAPQRKCSTRKVFEREGAQSADSVSQFFSDSVAVGIDCFVS